MEFLIAGCIAAAVGIALVVYALMPRGANEGDAIDRRLASDDSGAVKKGPPTKVATPHLMAAMKRAAPRIAAPMSDEEQSRLRKKLAAAGIRSESGPAIFLASKTVMGIVAAGLTLLMTWSLNQATLQMTIYTVFGGAMFFMLPDMYLSQVSATRSLKIKKGLADCLDMMVIMVESGLGMDASIARVGTEMDTAYPDLAGEFRLANAEMNMGLPRNEALQNLADRTGVREIQSLVATVIQAERFGSSIGKTLRVQSDMLRSKRQQAAEEAAGKTAVKLLIPLILFIFPALMVVVGGPAMITLIQETEGLE